MFDNTNPYTLQTEIIDDKMHYYISFADGQATSYETEVSHSVYMEFLRFAKKERNLRRWDERHIEQRELTDEMLYERALHKPKSLERIVSDDMQNEQLQLAIQQLPKIQRRRFVLYHEFGLTYEQIAHMEGCTFQAVALSIKIAEEKIKKTF